MKEVGVGVRFRRRFWVEVGFGSLGAGLALGMARVPDWIEVFFGRDPDGGDGSVEGIVALALSGMAAVLFAMAMLEWVRAAGGASTRRRERLTTGE